MIITGITQKKRMMKYYTKNIDDLNDFHCNFIYR